MKRVSMILAPSLQQITAKLGDVPDVNRAVQACTLCVVVEVQDDGSAEMVSIDGKTIIHDSGDIYLQSVPDATADPLFRSLCVSMAAAVAADWAGPTASDVIGEAASMAAKIRAIEKQAVE